LVVILATHDWIMHSQHFWRDDPNQFLEDIHLLHFSAPLIFLVVGLIMTSRFVRVLNDFEALNSNLESRVQMKHAELQESYQLTRALETQRAITEERDRIYRDLHDDVGAKLLSLVYRANTPENAQLARSALQELRDVVSTTHPENLSLEALNADWRTECEQRLSDAGIALNWETHGEFSAVYLTQPQALNLSRILREAISNLIKHAQAETARIQIHLEEKAVEILIQDDGIGCTSPTPGNGIGLRNMQARADRIQAAISIATAGATGCRIAVRLPLTPLQLT
jgi:signal transduction histidine kinase